MQKAFKYYGIALLGIFIAGATVFFFTYDRRERLSFNPGELTHIQTLRTEDKSLLGDIYVTYIDKDVFDALYVVRDIDGEQGIVYKINKDGLFNTLGQDVDIGNNNFYGYTFQSIDDDSFSVSLISEDRKSISEKIEVVWNDDRGIFNVFRPDYDDVVEAIRAGILYAGNGSELGIVKVFYLDKDREILDALIIADDIPPEMRALYRIIDKGFFNTLGKEREIPKGSFHGLKLASFKDDYVTVYLVDENGERSSEDITIKWNYEKNIFEIVQTS